MKISSSFLQNSRHLWISYCNKDIGCSVWLDPRTRTLLRGRVTGRWVSKSLWQQEARNPQRIEEGYPYSRCLSLNHQDDDLLDWGWWSTKRMQEITIFRWGCVYAQQLQWTEKLNCCWWVCPGNYLTFSSVKKLAHIYFRKERVPCIVVNNC